MGYGRVPLSAGHAQVLTARIGRHRQRPFRVDPVRPPGRQRRSGFAGEQFCDERTGTIENLPGGSVSKSTRAST